MNELEVEKMIGKNHMKSFQEFMRGQTVEILPDGTINYYEQDVEAFLRWRIIL